MKKGKKLIIAGLVILCLGLGLLAIGKIVKFNSATYVSYDGKRIEVSLPDDWTLNDIVQVFQENKGPFVEFGQLYTPGRDRVFFLSEDGWIYTRSFDEENPDYLQDLRLAKLGGETLDSLQPEHLLELYRSGEWNGAKIYSQDYHAIAYVGNNGHLCYTYYEPSLFYSDDNVSQIAEEKVYGTKMVNILDVAEENDTISEERVMPLYPDLPDGKFQHVISALRDGGTVAIYEDSVGIYKNCQLIKEWPVSLTEEARVIRRTSGEVLISTGEGDILRLDMNGNIETVAKNLLYEGKYDDDGFSAWVGLAVTDNHELCLYKITEYGEPESVILLAYEVENAVYLQSIEAILYAKNGSVYLLEGPIDEWLTLEVDPEPLGSEALEYYADQLTE